MRNPLCRIAKGSEIIKWNPLTGFWDNPRSLVLSKCSRGNAGKKPEGNCDHDVLGAGSQNDSFSFFREWVDRAPRLTDAGETPVTWSPSPASC